MDLFIVSVEIDGYPVPDSIWVSKASANEEKTRMLEEEGYDDFEVTVWKTKAEESRGLYVERD